MRHDPQRRTNVARQTLDLLLDALRACEEMEAVGALIDNAESPNVSWPIMQGAGRAVRRIAQAASMLVSELIEADDERRQRRRRRPDAAVPPAIPSSEAP